MKTYKAGLADKQIISRVLDSLKIPVSKRRSGGGSAPLPICDLPHAPPPLQRRAPSGDEGLEVSLAAISDLLADGESQAGGQV